MTEIHKETSSALYHGHTKVGTEVRKLLGINLRAERGVLLRTPGATDVSSNTGVVFVGARNVTANHAEGSGGMPLPPGQAVFIPIDDPSGLYVVSNKDDQDLAWMVM